MYIFKHFIAWYDKSLIIRKVKNCSSMHVHCKQLLKQVKKNQERQQTSWRNTKAKSNGINENYHKLGGKQTAASQLKAILHYGMHYTVTQSWFISFCKLSISSSFPLCFSRGKCYVPVSLTVMRCLVLRLNWFTPVDIFMYNFKHLCKSRYVSAKKRTSNANKNLNLTIVKDHKKKKKLL